MTTDKRHHAELRRLVADNKTSADVTSRIADLNQRITDADRRLPELERAVADLEAETISQAEAQAAFTDFDGLWESLIPREQARLLQLLLTSVDYDGDDGTVSVAFRPTSIRSLINRRLKDPLHVPPRLDVVGVVLFVFSIIAYPIVGVHHGLH